MIGNDIVDLTLANTQSNWHRARYLSKILTSDEQYFIDHLDEEKKHQMVWLLWSMKEAAYKIVSRKEKRRFCNPKLFNCRVLEKCGKHIYGEITFNNKLLLSQSIATHQYVYSLVNDQNLKTKLELQNQLVKNLNRDFNNPGDLYNYVLSKYATHKNIDISALSLKKCLLRTPYIFNTQTNQSIPISLTHHGDFGGFSIF